MKLPRLQWFRRRPITRPTADSSATRELGASTTGRPAGASALSSIGRPAGTDSLGRVEVGGVVWLDMGTEMPITARKCADETCSVCDHLPGPPGRVWVALRGPLAAWAARPPLGPQRAAQGSRPFSVVWPPGLFTRCDCAQCEQDRARMSGKPDTPSW